MAGRAKREALRKTAGFLDRIVEWNLYFCELIMLGMMLFITAEVICRSMLNFSFQVTDEVVGYMLVVMTFLGINISLRKKALFRVEFLYKRIPVRFRQHIETGFYFMSFAFAVVVDHQLIRLVISSYKREVMAPTLLATPLYLPQLFMPLGMTLMVCLLFEEFIRSLIDSVCQQPEENGSS